MNIRMVGIDYSKASLKQREIFAFTNSEAMESMKVIYSQTGVRGCVIISTCNRTEIWISEVQDNKLDLKNLICELKGVRVIKYKDFFVQRNDRDAILHLFNTSCGLKSQICGEDQILTQIKKAIENAREYKVADVYLEKLFQNAITSAKKIKTCTNLSAVDVSVATKVVETLKKSFLLEGLKCLIIGNGEMGRLVAKELVTQKANVIVTLRTYKHGTSLVPKGCESVDYDKRYEKISDTQVVISATSSPHCTLKYEDIIDKINNNKQNIFIDLAVPRDIDEKIGHIKNVKLFDIDSIGFCKNLLVNEISLKHANEIIREYIDKYLKWCGMRKNLDLINDLAVSASNKIEDNIKNDIESLNLDIEQKKFIMQRLNKVSEKAVTSMFFNLNENIDNEIMDKYFSSIKTIAK